MTIASELSTLLSTKGDIRNELERAGVFMPPLSFAEYHSAINSIVKILQPTQTTAVLEKTGHILFPSGSRTITKVSGMSANVGAAVTGSNGGEFTIASDGAWTFNPSGDFSALIGTETAETSVTYHASDGVSEAMGTLTVTVSSAVDSDPYWASVKLLIQPAADAADESTSITDVTGKSVYRGGAARIKTTLGYPAIYFPGGTIDWLAIHQLEDYAACAPGTSDFTFDMLLYPLAYGGTICGPTLFGTVYQSTAGYSFHLGQDQSSMRLTSNLTGKWADNLSVGTNGGPALNTLSHLAFEKYGDTLTMYKNGAIVAQMSGVAAWNFASGILRICIFNDGPNIRPLSGYVRAYRITHAARWRGVAFTEDVPAYPFLTS